MSIYSRDKCSPEQLKDFKQKVIKFLADNRIDYKKLKMRCQRNFDGNVMVFLYNSIMQNMRRSIRKEEDGNYYRSTYSRDVKMYKYFYRSEWNYYLSDENKDVRGWDLEDIKKYNLRN